MFATDHEPYVRRILDVLLVGSVAVVCLVSMFYTAYAPAAADDFCRSIGVGNGSWFDQILAAVDGSYREWSGRWATHAIYAAVFPYLGITTARYNLLLSLSLVLWIVFFFIFLQIFFRGTMSTWRKIMLATTLAATYFAYMPVPGETWLWLTGSIEYQLPSLVMAITLAMLTGTWFLGSSNVRRQIVVVAASLLALVVTGLNELVGLILFGLILVGLIAAASRGRRDVTIAVAFVAVVAAVGIAINVLAPGSEARIAHEQQAGNWPDSSRLTSVVREAFLEPGVTPVAWLRSSWFLWLSMLCLTSSWFAQARPSWVDWRWPLWRPISTSACVAPLVGIVGVHLCVLVVTYGQGVRPPFRVLNVVYSLLVVSWIASMAALPSHVRLAAKEGVVSRLVNVIAGVMLPLSLVTSPSVLRGIVDARWVLQDQVPALEARDREIRARVAAGETEISLDPISYSSTMFFWRELAADPRDWRNNCFALYYGAGSVAVGPK
jgi:hypothetical protein